MCKQEVTPLANDELNGSRGDNYKKMIDLCPVHRAGTTDEVGELAEFLMPTKAGFISVADFLIDGGTTASYWPEFYTCVAKKYGYT